MREISGTYGTGPQLVGPDRPRPCGTWWRHDDGIPFALGDTFGNCRPFLIIIHVVGVPTHQVHFDHLELEPFGVTEALDAAADITFARLPREEVEDSKPPFGLW